MVNPMPLLFCDKIDKLQWPTAPHKLRAKCVDPLPEPNDNSRELSKTVSEADHA
jgi:hypothetical protein